MRLTGFPLKIVILGLAPGIQAVFTVNTKDTRFSKFVTTTALYSSPKFCL